MHYNALIYNPWDNWDSLIITVTLEESKKVFEVVLNDIHQKLDKHEWKGLRNVHQITRCFLN